MGAIYVNVIIRNPADTKREWQGEFLVDTGATDCVVSKRQLEEIGLVPKDQRTYVLADGSEYHADVTVAEVELMGGIVGATVIMADADVEPLLGVTALESAGIEIDPRNETLRRLPAVRLKRLART